MILIKPSLSGSRLRRFQGRSGQTLMEYSLVIAFVSIVAISVLASTGTQVKSVFTTIDRQMTVSQNGGPVTQTTR